MVSCKNTHSEESDKNTAILVARCVACSLSASRTRMVSINQYPRAAKMIDTSNKNVPIPNCITISNTPIADLF